MQVSRIQANYFTNVQNNINAEAKARTSSSECLSRGESKSSEFSKVPIGYKYGVNIHFGEYIDPNRTVPHIDFFEYHAMSDATKRRYRKRYKTFLNTVDQSKLAEPEKNMPLSTKKTMAAFIDTAKFYSQYKDHQIICLGRSPKWFLNAAKWMKDGIDDYKFVAFSKYWFRPDYEEGAKKVDRWAPTEKEEYSYKRYLKRIQADPQSIVNNYKKTGQKTIITDYIQTGKGVSSFLDLMGRYADELGILDEFANSIEIVGIGSREFTEEKYAGEYELPEQRVFMPPILQPYDNKIKQTFHDIDYDMFKDMLYSQNVNECRSTYYPHTAWTLYTPDRFKTGLIKDMKKVKALKKELSEKAGPNHTKCLSSFTPEMFDYRNLVSFHILDEMEKAGVLRDNDKTYRSRA